MTTSRRTPTTRTSGAAVPRASRSKAKTAIPTGGEDDDVEAHSHNKNKWGGGPEGLAQKSKTAIPTGGEDDDVEGHSFDLSRGTGGELIDRKMPGGDSPHGEGVATKQKL